MTEAVENTKANPDAQVQPDAKPKKVKQTPEEKAAAKAEKDRIKAEAKANKPEKVVVAKDTKNGVTRPATGVTLLVWTTADQLSTKAPVERAKVVEALKGKVEVGTIHTQYGRWRKYYGLVETKEQRQARLDAAKVKKQEAAAAKKAERQAEKDKKAQEKAAADAKKAQEKADKDAAKAAAAAAKAAAEKSPEPQATA